VTEELVERLRYDCELALQLGGEARVVLPATDVSAIADTIEAQAAEIERLKVECQAQYYRGYYDGRTALGEMK